MVMLITSPLPKMSSAVVESTPVTVGLLVSMTRSALAPREPVTPGWARVRKAALPAASLMVPPLRARAVEES